MGPELKDVLVYHFHSFWTELGLNGDAGALCKVHEIARCARLDHGMRGMGSEFGGSKDR